MRQIKFRCWTGVSMVETQDETRASQSITTAGDILNNYESHIMQFIGLQDKNGRDIYEEDIVRILYTDWISNTDASISLDDYKKALSSYGHVVYNAPKFEVYFPAHRQHGSIIPGMHGEIEVIGNMYEHKELLK